MSVIYLAGPMRGFKDGNHAAFDEATELLRSHGHTVHSPAEVDRQDDAVFADDHVYTRDELWYVIHRDLLLISESDEVAFLPGWTQSSGARLEFALGKFLGLTFRRSDGRHVTQGELNRELAGSLKQNPEPTASESEIS